MKTNQSSLIMGVIQFIFKGTTYASKNLEFASLSAVTIKYFKVISADITNRLKFLQTKYDITNDEKLLY